MKNVETKRFGILPVQVWENNNMSNKELQVQARRNKNSWIEYYKKVLKPPRQREESSNTVGPNVNNISSNITKLGNNNCSDNEGGHGEIFVPL